MAWRQRLDCGSAELSANFVHEDTEVNMPLAIRANRFLSKTEPTSPRLVMMRGRG
jgi:hypothetical protein